MATAKRGGRDELLQQVERFAPVLEISPNAFILTDLDANVVSWNPAAERLFGYPAGEAIGRNLDDLVAATKELHPDAVALSERMSSEGDRTQAIVRRTRKDGTLIDVEVLATPLVVDGRAVGIIGSYHDVTEVNRQRRFFEALLDASPQAIVTLDLDDRVTSWNQAAQRLFGYSLEEVVGRDINELVASRPDLLAEGREIDRLAATGQTLEHRVTQRMRKDGTAVDVDVVGGPVTVDGRIVAKHAFYHDVTELQEQKRYFESLLELSPEAIVTTDLDDRVTSWNRAAEVLFGYPADEAIGRYIGELVARRPDLLAEGNAMGQMDAPTPHLFTQRTTKDGTLVDVDVVGGPVIVGEEIVAKHIFYHDVTELQEQKRYFQSLLEISPAAILVTDLESKVVSWNPAAERLFGYPTEEAVGALLDDLVATRPELHREALGYTERALRGESFWATAQRTRKDGSLVDVQMVSAPVVVNEKRIGSVVIYHDITEVQQQKRYFESLLELSPTAIAVVDLESRIVSWNPAAERLFGYTADEVVGRVMDDVVASRPDLHDEAARYSEAAERGELVQALTQRTRRDGSLVDVVLHHAPVTVAGERVGFLVIYLDITEVQQQRRWFESVLRLSPTAIITVDDDTKVTSWNPGAERLFGYRADEAVGSHLDDLVANAPEIRDEAARYSAEGIAGKEVRLITRRTRKDGSLVDVELLVAPVEIGGERVGHSVIYHDIGEIQRQKRYYEALVQANPVAIVLMDPAGTVTSWNPAAERLFGYSVEEAIGRHIDDLIATDPTVRAEAMEATEVGMSGELVHLITKRTRKDGALVDVEVFGAPVIVGDEALGLYGLFIDIRDLQQARRGAEAATEAKSAFLATMSHEIRTPLNAMIGMTGLLLDTELSSEQRHFAEVIRGSGDALLGVINDILDFSKVEAGRLELERAPFDLRECLESALELVAPAAADKGLDLAYDVGDEVPRGVVGDLTRLRQVLINLLNNAVKFTQAGEVVVSVSSEQLTDLRHRLTFEVRDTGIGIPADRIDRLFESFSQLDATTTRRYGGTGLGLAISRRLVELMGGSLSAQSVVGEGSTFRFAIEVEAADVPGRAYEVSQATELRGKRVLVVDDNATNRQILARQVGAWGMLARETGSPTEALAWVGSDDGFDVAILDMQMPEMDGVALAGEIRRVRAGLPLVMLTSLGRPDGGPEEAFDAYLSKPIRPSQLYDAMMAVFGGDVDETGRRGVETGGRARHAPALRILVVEDNAVNQQLALLLLEKLGYQRADVAANGIEAIEAVERQPYDAILMDVEMPEMDGLEATRRIRATSSPDHRPHIIAVTANALQGERERCLEAGMDDYLTKPLRVQELSEALGRSPRGAARPPSVPAIDPEVLGALASSLGERGTESVRELIATFEANVPALRSALEAAVERGDADEARRAAHTLKSNATTFGARSLTEASLELERSAGEGSLEGAHELMARIWVELERVTDELPRLGAELGR